MSAATALLAMGATAAHADDDYVKYYTVTSSHNGAKENLTEIADRFLGDSARSAEVFNLNSGRPQPDGGVLVDPGRLAAGWMLILPWDAVGGGVQYGVLPDKSPTAAVTPSAAAKPSPSSTRGSTSAAAPGTSTGTTPPKPKTTTSGSKDKKPKPGKAKTGKSGQCATAGASTRSSNWAELRLAADQAWPQSRGDGQLVAVVDSGVDGSLPQLTGHVAVGSDIVSGSGRGDTDCLGTGTAMAGLIAAKGGSGGGPIGVAPDATVMPIRIAGTSTKVQAADAAAGISAAVAAGATVIALGSYVDTNDKGVADAVAEATKKDVVVVLGASLGAIAVNPDAMIGAGTVRVGGIGVDGQAAGDYRKGGVDVVAPGINVTSLGITGTGSLTGSGTQYAVAFVAGATALVRSAYPELTAEQVVHRLEATASKMGNGSVPNGTFGFGLINPAESVTKVLPEEVVAAESDAQALSRVSSEPNSGRSTLLIVVTLVAIAAAVLLVFRIRGLLRGEAPPEQESTEPPAGDDTPPPATRPPSVKPTAQQETLPITPGIRPGEKVTVPAAPAATVSPASTPEAPANPKASVGAKSAQPSE
ncbi:S8 family serine peptidase [Actinoplanes sp. NPDC051494]|uniref:S8 family serine peptidase n=1 Tax=Actinoplanes sp. NPDC051494 TaxID=3363907 RepID=UPI00379E97E8